MLTTCITHCHNIHYDKKVILEKNETRYRVQVQFTQVEIR
jgi:hypothetical protein